jgi:hypothetical protein
MIRVVEPEVLPVCVLAAVPVDVVAAAEKPSDAVAVAALECEAEPPEEEEATA